jgi:intron-binding protein aquarius
MPPAKRAKKSADARSKSITARPNTDDFEGENEFATLARQHWLKGSKQKAVIKVKKEVVKSDIWDALEQENFPSKSLLVLEGLQLLERWEIMPVRVWLTGQLR